jgi:hypothetical protein
VSPGRQAANDDGLATVGIRHHAEYHLYILLASDDHLRRIFTDGRDWPKDLEPTFAGYSIGKWIDEDGDGRYDVLEVETRGFKGPRSIDTPGLPLHPDNQSIFKERVYRDKANPNIIHDELTTIDHAFTRPWTVDKQYVGEPEPYLQWTEYYCTENNPRVRIGKEIYYMSADGLRCPSARNSRHLSSDISNKRRSEGGATASGERPIGAPATISCCGSESLSGPPGRVE